MTPHYRDAGLADLPAIVSMLADDTLGAGREEASLPLDPAYLAAFAAIERSPGQRLVVAVAGEQVVGTMQLLIIPGIANRGAWHGQIESVRIAAPLRGTGQGEAFARWAIGQCREAGCGWVQLVSHSSRDEAHRFWRKLGFIHTHVGFKLAL